MPLCVLELAAVHSCFKKLVDNLDVKEILPYLCQTGDIDVDTAIQIEQENNRKANTTHFLLHTVQKCSFENFLRSLQEYHGFIVNAILNNLNRAVRFRMENLSPYEAVVHAIHSPRCIKVHQFFNQIYCLYNNGDIEAFVDEFQKVEWLWYNRETLSEKVAMMTSDLYCMVLCVQYNRIANEGDCNVHIKMLQKFQNVLRYTSDQNRFEILMLCQKAKLLSKDDVQSAIRTARDVVQISSVYQNGVEALESSMCFCTVALADTERSRTSENRKNLVDFIMNIIERINNLDQDSKEDYKLHKVIAYVVAAMTLININEDGKDLGSEDLKLEEISQAKKLLTYIEEKENWKNLPNRWKVLIFLGKAKLALITKDENRAHSFMECVRYCSKQIKYMPHILKNIREFESKYFIQSSYGVLCSENAIEGAGRDHEILYQRRKENCTCYQ